MPVSDRETTNDRNREIYKNVREIGPPPKVKKPRRRSSCKNDFRKFLTAYLGGLFPLAFSPAHERFIQELEAVILKGKRIVVVMPRGSGKTTIMLSSLIWSAVYGHRRFPLIITADDTKYKQLLRAIRVQFETNELLLEDFPELLHPIRALDRIALRAKGQICEGNPTYMEWSSEQIILPTTKYTDKRGNSGGVIIGGGLTGAVVRGAMITTPSGENVRPDCILVDDPQTRSSAKSESQTQDRWDILFGDLMGTAGPGKDLAFIVTATVIYEDDLADRLLDPDKARNFSRVREATITSWPDDMDAWDKYGEIDRQESTREVEEGEAHKYYLENREQLDKGASVYWEERVLPGYASALESAMVEYLRDPRSFLAERQNEPTQKVGEGARRLSARELVQRRNGYPRGVLPQDVQYITAHIDVQGKLLYWVVCAFTGNFGAYVIDYGTTPEQPSNYFTLLNARRTYHKMFKDADESGALRGAIKHTVQMLASKTYKRVDGAEMQINRGLVDAGWSTDDVESAMMDIHVANWMPSYGVAVKASANPLAKWNKPPGAIRGNHWISMKPSKRNLVSLFVDANFWKTDTANSLVCDINHSSGTTFFRARKSEHQLMSEHCSSEAALIIASDTKGQAVEEWSLVIKGTDNHWWDNLYMCRAAASTLGVTRGHGRNGSTKKTRQRKKSGRVRAL